MSSICLNAIVRNEAANIERMLRSICPHVDGIVIVDTGSTDNTVEIIKKICSDEAVHCEIYHVPFHNFSQARNYALRTAIEVAYLFHYDHILLADADMELINGAALRNKFNGADPAYYMTQHSSGLVYHNVRLIHRDLDARYIGVTHEYLDIGNFHPATFDDAYFIDHATGSNRNNKFKRDIQLLLDDMKHDPSNPRSWFYLAKSYMDDGQFEKAVDVFKRRIELGDWFEEVWHSQLELARCYQKLGKREFFIEAMLKAVDMKPDRAEPLYDLAKYFRENGENRTSTIFSKAGLSLPKPFPGGALFIEQWVYDWALEWEYSVTAFYDERERATGFTACDHMSLAAQAPDYIRAQAKSNLFHYTPLLSDIAPSWQSHEIIPTGLPDGYVAMNPSITARGNELWVVVRCVNYRITDTGHYDMRGDTAIRTRNLLVPYNIDGPTTELIMPGNWPAPLYDQVIGWEDMRLFVAKGGKFGVNACVREANQQGWCEQWVAFINEATGELDQPHLILPKERQHEKNWAPVNLGEQTRFKYRPTMLIDSQGQIEHTISDSSIRIDDLSGGSQLISYDGGWLAVVHESGVRPDNGQRWYRHRFIWYDINLSPARVSKPFCLNHKGIEFVAGLAANPNDGTLMLSYGVNDREAWIGKIDRREVRDLLWATH